MYHVAGRSARFAFLGCGDQVSAASDLDARGGGERRGPQGLAELHPGQHPETSDVDRAYPVAQPARLEDERGGLAKVSARRWSLLVRTESS